MKLVRKPAYESGISIAGGAEIISGYNKAKTNNIGKSPNKQSFLYGNRCGYNKNQIKKPTFYGSDGYTGKRGKAIGGAISTLWEIVNIKCSPPERKLFRDRIHTRDTSATRLMALFENERLRQLFHHDHQTKNKKFRSFRGERMVSSYGFVTPSVLDGIDLRTMAFGFFDYKSGRQIYHDYDYIARKQGISISQVQRNISRLVEKNVLFTQVINKKDELGEYRHNETRIFLNPEIFSLLGLTEQYEKDRLYAEERHLEKLGKLNRIKEAIMVRSKKIEFDNHKKRERKALKIELKKEICQKKISASHSLNKYREGKPLTQDEIQLLESEMPGFNRIKHTYSPRYRDYPGCSHDPSLLRQRNHQDAVHISQFIRDDQLVDPPDKCQS